MHCILLVLLQANNALHSSSTITIYPCIPFDVHRYRHSVKEAEVETVKGAFITSCIMGVNFLIGLSMFAVSFW